MAELLVFLYEDYPWYSGLSDRVSGIVQQLLKHGLRVRVVAPLVYGCKRSYVPTERVYLRWLGVQRGPRLWRKVISLFSWLYFQLRCLVKVLKNVKNVGAIQFEHFYTFPVAYTAKLILRRPIVADDINLLHIRPLSPLKRKMFFIIEERVLENSDFVATASPLTLAVAKNCFRAAKLLYLPNAVQKFDPVCSGVKEKWIVFIGNLNFQQNVRAAENIFDIIGKLAKLRQDFKVLIVGSPLNNVAHLTHHKLVKDGLVEFLGSIPDDVLANIFSRALIALLPFFGLPRWGGQMTKTLRMMASGLCVVASPEAVRWIEGAEPYVHYIPVTSADECARVLDELLDDVERCTEVGLKARELMAGNYTWERVCAEYVAIIKRLLVNRAS